MDNFFDNMAPEDAKNLDSLSKLLIELRESHSAMLNHYEVSGEPALFEKIREGIVDEHPAYEVYLGAKLIDSTKEAVRKELRDYMLEEKPE